MIKLRDLIQETLTPQDIEYQKYQANKPKADLEHEKSYRNTGFYGKQGAGAIVLAKSTGHLLLPFRSQKVLQPGTWGVWGGAIDAGDDPKATVLKEMKEEVGYTGKVDELIPLYVFEHPQSGFKYFNFLAVVPGEFVPKLNWETDDFDWVEFGDWPTPLHFGLKALIQHSGNDIKKAIEKYKKVSESIVFRRNFWK